MPETGGNNYPELHPVVRQLQRECKQLRTELAKLVCDYDILVNTIGPNLEADYLIKIGHLQYDLFCADTSVRRLKRKIEMLQAALNSGDRIDISIVDAKLDEEFEDWQRQAEGQFAKIQAARQQLSSLHNPEDSAEIKKLYRQLARRLHPDVNPKSPEKAHALWLQVATAYKNGDLEELRVLALLVDEIPGVQEQLSSIEKLKKRRKTLAGQIEALLVKRAELRQMFPFDLEEKLADSEWVAENQREYTEQIAATSEQTQSLELFLAETQWSSVELQPTKSGVLYRYLTPAENGWWLKNWLRLTPKCLLPCTAPSARTGCQSPSCGRYSCLIAMWPAPPILS